MLHVDEVITRKEVAVMFDDGNIAAGLPKDTERVFLPKGGSGRLLEYLHLDPPDILALPLVEDGAEKIAQDLSRDRAVADSAFSVYLRLDQGQKTNVSGVDLLEEPVDFGGMPDVL